MCLHGLGTHQDDNGWSRRAEQLAATAANNDEYEDSVEYAFYDRSEDDLLGAFVLSCNLKCATTLIQALKDNCVAKNVQEYI